MSELTVDLTCPTCGQVFETAHGLGGHLSAAHKPLVNCPECSKPVREGVGLTQHMKLVHGVHKITPSGERQRKFNGARKKDACPVCQKVLGAKDIARHLREVHKMAGGIRAYRANQRAGQVDAWAREQAAKPVVTAPVIPTRRIKPLTAEQITRSACALLWPDGVPHGEMEGVLRWHTHTVEFLTQATSGERE